VQDLSGEIRHLLVLADHGQFYVQDLAAHGAWMQDHCFDPDLPAAGWSEDAVYVHRIGVEPHSISVGTARSDMVEMSLQFHSAAPVPALTTAQHVVEADIDIPGGVLAISGPADDPGHEQLVIAPRLGRYRVRVSYLPSRPPQSGVNELELGDHFHYQLNRWPVDDQTALSILKQGPCLWAG
jgi:hypothetical protein